MIDLEALLVQILLLGVFGVVYAWIGGKIGFRSGIKEGKKEIYELFEINPNEWKHLSPKEKRAKIINIASSLIKDTLKEAGAPNPDANEDTTKEEDDPILPNPENYK